MLAFYILNSPAEQSCSKGLEQDGVLQHYVTFVNMQKQVRHGNYYLNTFTSLFLMNLYSKSNLR